MSGPPSPREMEAEPVIAISIKMPNGEVRGLNFQDGNELEIGTLAQLQGILKALRAIMKVPEGISILHHCITMVRRYEASWPPKPVEARPDRSEEYGKLTIALLRNSEKLDREFDYFKAAVGGLSNLKRRHAFEYVEALKERINLLEKRAETE